MSKKDDTPIGWRKSSVAEICEVSRGRVISQIEIGENPGIYPVYSSQSQSDGIFGFLDSFDFDGEYVTWTTDGAHAGTVFYRSGRFNCTNVCGTLRAMSDDLCMPFVARALSRVAKRHVSYVGNPKLMNNIMSEIQLTYPGPDEQRRIALILDTADAAIAKTEALIAKFKQMKAGLLHDLLTRGIDENGELRNAFKSPAFFNDVAGELVPKSWTTMTLNDVGTWHAGGTPSKRNSGFWDGSIPWLTPKDMKIFRLTKTTDYVTELGASCGTRRVPADSIFIVVRGMILAHTFPICISTEEFTFNQDIRALTTNGIANMSFLAFWFAANEQRMLGITSEATHGTKRIDMAELRKVALSLPPRPEQDEIARRLTELDCRIDLESAFLAKICQLKSGLMNDLLTGRKPVFANAEAVIQ